QLHRRQRHQLQLRHTATATLTVGTALLTVTPDNDSITYGDAEPGYTYNITGFVNGEDEGTAAGYVAPTCDSNYDQFDAVGPYTISCTGGTATNYTFDTTATAILTVGAAQLTVDPSDMTRHYGAPEPAFDFDVTGFMGSDSTISAAGYTGPNCNSDYDAGDPVGTYTITCSGGSATDYTFDTTSTATLTITPFVLGSEEVVYSGQTEVQTRSSSDTFARVTLSASITADFDSVDASNTCTEGGPSVSDATATFRDLSTGQVIASGVPIAEVGGNCEEGIATIFTSLSSGQMGMDVHLIEVTIAGSFSGANDFQIGNAPESASVVVSMPSATGTMMDSGGLPFVAQSSYYSLGTEGSLTSAMDGDDVVIAGYRFVAGTRKVSPKGQAVLVIPAPNGGVYYIKTNSITSMSVGSTMTTIFTKANIQLIGGDCETPCAVDGNVSLRLDISSNGDVGYTVQSSKTSALYYSNNWYKSGKVWKTMPQDLTLL
ncbi:MAG: MBG domain-containing protein, partial [Actinomycetota bacterium]